MLVVGFALTTTQSIFAQATTSAVSGVVVDDSGAPLDAATVVAVHTPSGTQYGITTQADGRFTIQNMRVGGPYAIEASYVGLEADKKEGIFLTLGQKLTVNFALKSGAVDLEGVEVVSDRANIFGDDRTGASTNITSEQLSRLPTISRSAADYTRLAPNSDGNSFGGRNDQFNNFSLDGSIFNNPFGLDAATPGGQTDAQPISLDAIDQIQVSFAPFDVTQAGFTGASVNAVTKSGTNEFKGTIFGFYRNQDMTGSKVSGNEIFVPDLEQFQAGFSIGGPIIKNKLFFFANAEVERRTDLGANFIAASPSRTGENVSRVEEQDLIAVSNILNSRFGYQTGEYENYIHETNNEKGIFKLDWNITQNHTLTATYNFLNASKQKPAHPSALGRRGPDATTLQFFNSGYQINNVIHSGLVELRSLFGNRFANKFQVGYTAFRDTRDPLSSPFPVVNINRDGARYIVAGHEPFSINNVLDQDVLQITNNFNVYAGKHTLTFGGSLERFNFNNSFNLGVYEPFGVPYPGGTFGPGFNSVDEFIEFVNGGGMDAVVDHAEATFAGNNANDSWALAETNVGQFALYAQDEYAVNDNFTLTVGLRMDMPLYFDTPELIQENIDRAGFAYDPSIVYTDENGENITFDHTELPEGNVLFSPRVGFNWDVKGDQTFQLRGGSGLFTGRFPFVWIGNQVANPNSFFYNVTRTDFNFPQVWRNSLGLDKKFDGGWIFTTDLTFTKDVNAMMVRNYGVAPPSGRLNGVDTRPVYTDADRTSIGNAAYVFTNTSLGWSFNGTVQLQRKWSNGLYTSIAYNFLDARDASSIEAEISSDAFDRNPIVGHANAARLTPSLYGNRHRVVGSAHKKFTYGSMATTFAVFFEYAQGGCFSYTYSNDINGDAGFNNDLIYIPTEADLPAMLFTGTADEQAAQRTALNNFIEQDDYLSERRGEDAEKYSILSPWFSRWDVRILQDFNLKVGEKTNTIQFSVDILNFGNLLSSDFGVRQFPTNTQPIGVFINDNGDPVYSFDTNLTDTFTDDFSLLSRWQLQLGLRYIF